MSMTNVSRDSNGPRGACTENRRRLNIRRAPVAGRVERQMGTRPPVPERANFASRKSSLLSAAGFRVTRSCSGLCKFTTFSRVTMKEGTERDGEGAEDAYKLT